VSPSLKRNRTDVRGKYLDGGALPQAAWASDNSIVFVLFLGLNSSFFLLAGRVKIISYYA
jgi:hypothetical protein